MSLSGHLFKGNSRQDEAAWTAATDKLRWHHRLCTETPQLGLAAAATALQALAAIARGEDQQGIEALAGALEATSGGLVTALERQG